MLFVKTGKGRFFMTILTIPSELDSERLKLIKISLQSIFFHKRVRGDPGLSRRRTVQCKFIHIKIILKTVHLLLFLTDLIVAFYQLHIPSPIFPLFVRSHIISSCLRCYLPPPTPGGGEGGKGWGAVLR